MHPSVGVANRHAPAQKAQKGVANSPRTGLDGSHERFLLRLVYRRLHRDRDPRRRQAAGACAGHRHVPHHRLRGDRHRDDPGHRSDAAAHLPPARREGTRGGRRRPHAGVDRRDVRDSRTTSPRSRSAASACSASPSPSTTDPGAAHRTRGSPHARLTTRAARHTRDSARPRVGPPSSRPRAFSPTTRRPGAQAARNGR